MDDKQKEAKKILVIGATGNVGKALVKELYTKNIAYKAAVKKPRKSNEIKLDFDDSNTFKGVLTDVDRIFVMLPPGLNPEKINSFLEECEDQYIIFLSVLQAPEQDKLPHNKIEKYIKSKNLKLTSLYCGFFMQNFSGAHKKDVEQGKIEVPANYGKASFVDCEDIAKAAAKLFIMKNPKESYYLTGSKALSMFEVAETFTDILGHSVIYTNPSTISFILKRILRGDSFFYAVTMSWVYGTLRDGSGAKITTDLEKILGRQPNSFSSYVKREKNIWIQ